MKNISLLFCLLISLGMMSCSKKNNVTRVQAGGQSHDQQQSKPANQASAKTEIQDAAEVIPLHRVVVDDHFGFIDDSGKMVIPPTFDYASSFADGLALVSSNGHYGYINKDGHFAVTPQYQDAEDFSEGIAAAKLNGQWGYIDKRGAFLVQPQFVYGSNMWRDKFRQTFSDGFLVVVDNPLDCHYINVSGKRLTLDFPERVNRCQSFSENLAWVAVGCYEGAGQVCGGWRIINRDGKSVSPILSVGPLLLGSFHDGLSSVVTHGEPTGSGGQGYVDTTGRFAISPQFTYAGDFSEGIAKVGMGTGMGKFGYIDTTGKYIVPPTYDLGDDFTDGMAAVVMRTSGKVKIGYIDRTGKLAVPLILEASSGFTGGLALAAKDGLWGIIDRQGKWVLAPTFAGEEARFDGNLGVIITHSDKTVGIPSSWRSEDVKAAAAARSGDILTMTFIDKHGHQIWKSAAFNRSVLVPADHLR